MKLLNYRSPADDAVRLGISTEAGVIDVAAAAAAANLQATVGADTDGCIAAGSRGLAELTALCEWASRQGEPGSWLLPEAGLRLAPCVLRPGKLLCVGLNYRKHAEETGASIPAYPVLFSKFGNALAAHGDEIALPAASREVDYEAELAIVIGRAARDVPVAEALDHVYGYCCANDLSARDLQLRTSQWLLGKSCDGFAPLGPWLVTADEVGDPNRLAIGCTVNGVARQRSDTSDMIFRCDEIVSYVSRHMTLLPGDVILTGTPEGVVLGYPESERVYLRRGDIAEVEIAGLGRLRNRFV
ncbi:fumarylacetoacetate hydrolase family protein [Cohnella fermenti]|uniref:Fumarylacetoacetate hydrolase family protein n=1 Tax=Cohnella fermenti TaxID=2565925 RepID=A0A4S4C373_9BACL|nr:fumarylacetoacetate hydrolase family protein [Cohnella fermenti]THF82175.1 fumarylacetoacetate hydrolase family protein [Cohnella fermenti]